MKKKSRLLFLFIGLLSMSSCVSKKQLTNRAKSQSLNSDSLAIKVIEQTGNTNWDSAKIAIWKFGKRLHTWDLKTNEYMVEYDEFRAEFDLDDVYSGVVADKGDTIVGKKRSKILKKEYHWWANNSFWMNPIPKFFDEGVERYAFSDKKGVVHLIVCYRKSNGKIGDLYDWHLNKENLPYMWGLYVKIIPIKGIKTSWENWQSTISGVRIATLHRFSRKKNKKGKGWGLKIEEVVIE